MKLSPEQLVGHLKSAPLPAYLVTGDEPLIIEECCDRLRAAFKEAGFVEREVLHVEGQFKWEYLLECANALSLFAEQKLIEIRLGHHKVPKAASNIIQEYLAHAPADNILLIIANKLDGGAKKSAWFKDFERAGAVIEVWPVESKQLPGWIRHRASQVGITLDNSATQALSDLVEGNLLAAKQELDKLGLLYPNQELTEDQVIQAVADHSRYDVYGLMDAIAAQQPERCIKILNVLHQEGTEPPVVLWALSKEIRTLYAISQGLSQGLAYETICQKQRIWGKRKGALQRCAQNLSIQTLEGLLGQCRELDQIIKGMADGSPWLTLQDIALVLARGRPL